MKKIVIWFRIHHIHWCILLAVALFVTRGFSLDQFVTTDETPWLMRSANFYFALGQRDFAKTNQDKDPGVTTMWVNTAAFLIEAPQYRGFGEGYFKAYIDFDNFVNSKGIDPHQILVTGRKIMLAEEILLLLIAFGFSIQIFGVIPSFTVFMLIAVDPFHIALTRVSHLDGQLSCLMLVSLMAFLLYLNGKHRYLSLIVSAISAGLACLTKLPGYLLLLYFAFIFALVFVKEWRARKAKSSADYQLPQKVVLHILLWVGIFAATYFILWPAMWVNPIKTIAQEVEAPFSFLPEDQAPASNINTNPTASNDKIVDQILKYPTSYLWQSTPVEVIGVFIALIAMVWKKGVFKDKWNRMNSINLFVYSLLYLAFISVIPKSNPRYMIPAYIVLLILSAFGWLSLISWLLRTDKAIARIVSLAILSGILYFQVFQVASYYPYFFSYYDPLLGGSVKAGESKFVGSGEGLDQAGRYLSQKPNAQNLTAISWYGSGCFSYYFAGKTIIIPTGISFGYITDNLNKADYLVVYTNQWYRRIPPELFDILDHAQPEKSIWINGIEYARIYPVEPLLDDIYK